MAVPTVQRPPSVAASISLVSDLVANAGRTTAVIAPFDGTVLHDLPLSNATDVADAAYAARVAQLRWRAARPGHRRRVLLAAHDLLLAR